AAGVQRQAARAGEAGGRLEGAAVQRQRSARVAEVGVGRDRQRTVVDGGATGVGIAAGKYGRAGARLYHGIAAGTAGAGFVGDYVRHGLGVSRGRREGDGAAAALQEDAGAEGRAGRAAAGATTAADRVAVDGERAREGEAAALLHEDGAAHPGTA